MGAGALWGAKSVNDVTGGKAGEFAKKAGKGLAGLAFDDSSKPETQPDAQPGADDDGLLDNIGQLLSDNKGGIGLLMGAAALWWKGPQATQDLAFWLMVASVGYLAYQNWGKMSFNTAAGANEKVKPETKVSLSLGQPEEPTAALS